MSVYVPGYGTFSKEIPSWLELRSDGLLYNRNASDPNRPWRPPEGYVGDATNTFTPGVETVPGGSVPEPTPGPIIEPPPVFHEPTEPVPTTPPVASDPLAPFFKEFFDALHAATVAYRANLDKDAAAVKVRLDEETALAKTALDKFDALIAALAAIAPK